MKSTYVFSTSTKSWTEFLRGCRCSQRNQWQQNRGKRRNPVPTRQITFCLSLFSLWYLIFFSLYLVIVWRDFAWNDLGSRKSHPHYDQHDTVKRAQYVHSSFPFNDPSFLFPLDLFKLNGAWTNLLALLFPQFDHLLRIIPLVRQCI